ncbi:MAG: ABC transporter permease [Methanotrichaceae archaeon]
MHVDPLGDFFRNIQAVVGLAMLSLVVIIAVFAPKLSACPPDYYTGLIFNPPSYSHLLGTDSMGQDIWSRLLFGARTSLAVAVSVAFLSTALSIFIGGTSALIGGVYDSFWMRVVDAVLAVPSIIVMILVGAYLRPSLLLLILMLSVLSWPGGARVMRSQILSLKKRMHVSAARTFGAGWRHILANHILPELGPLVTALMIQDARRAVFMEAGLAFLGVSDPMMISWGKTMQQALAFTYLDVWKWWLVPTGLALSLTLIGLSFLSLSLEAAMDPRLNKSKQLFKKSSKSAPGEFVHAKD